MTLTFPREIGLKRTVVGSKLLYKKYVNKMRTLTSCYTSLYSFDKMNEEGRPDYRSARIDRAWWDFDAGELGGLNRSSVMSLNSSTGLKEMSELSLLGVGFIFINSLINLSSDKNIGYR